MEPLRSLRCQDVDGEVVAAVQAGVCRRAQRLPAGDRQAGRGAEWRFGLAVQGLVRGTVADRIRYAYNAPMGGCWYVSREGQLVI